MTARDVKKKHFSHKDIENTLWGKTLDGKILRIIGVGYKYIRLISNNGDIRNEERIIAAARYVSDLDAG